MERAMLTKYCAIKLLFTVYVFLIFAVEIALLFVPYGPLGNTNYHSIIVQRSQQTKNSGQAACIACGRPAKLVYYRGRVHMVPISDYCEAHAPSSLEAGKDGINKKDSIEEVWSAGIFAVIGAFMYSAVGLMVFNISALDVGDVRALWRKYLLHPTIALLLYIAANFLFFWMIPWFFT